MKGQLKTAWSTLAGRINAMSLRERALLFVSILACLLVLADILWLSPAQVAHKLAVQRFDRQGAELRVTRQAVSQLAKPIDAGKAVRDEIASTQARLAEVNESIGRIAPVPAGAPPLAEVLTHLLRRHDGLTLVRTSSVAPQAGGASAQPSAPSADPALVGFTRQGVELTVSGPYAELTRYVKTLEHALPYVRWGTMTLKSEKPPPELTLQLFLVGVKP